MVSSRSVLPVNNRAGGAGHADEEVREAGVVFDNVLGEFPKTLVESFFYLGILEAGLFGRVSCSSKKCQCFGLLGLGSGIGEIHGVEWCGFLVVDVIDGVVLYFVSAIKTTVAVPDLHAVDRGFSP